MYLRFYAANGYNAMPVIFHIPCHNQRTSASLRSTLGSVKYSVIAVAHIQAYIFTKTYLRFYCIYFDYK